LYSAFVLWVEFFLSFVHYPYGKIILDWIGNTVFMDICAHMIPFT
jgi:hypothetical protein